MCILAVASNGFIGHCKFEKNLSSKTIKAYQTDLCQFQKFLLEKNYSTEVVKITKVEVRDYLEAISILKPKSIKRKIATIKAMFNYLEFDDIIAMNPLRKMRIKIKEPKQLPRALNIKEIGDIFKSVYKANITPEDKNSYSYFAEIRNIAVVELLFATGGRVSEISNLKDNQIDLQSGQVILRGKGDKERIIQVCNKDTIALLKKYRKLSVDRIKTADNFFLVNRFNCRLSDQSIRNIVNTFSNIAKIQTHVTPHVFRHSFATLLLEKDVDIKYIQSMLGHSSIMTTQIYTHVNKEKQKQILRTKHPRKDFSTEIFSCPNKG